MRPCSLLPAVLKLLVSSAVLVYVIVFVIERLRDCGGGDGGGVFRDVINASRAVHVHQNRSVHVVFVGGVSQSGSAALRSTLGSLPNVWWVDRTHVIAQIIGFRGRMVHSPGEYRHLAEAGVTTNVVEAGMRAFIDELSAKSSRAGHYLFINDVSLIVSLREMLALFPNSKALLLNRDGRAVAHSVVVNRQQLGGVSTASFVANLKRWNELSVGFNAQCRAAGAESCLSLHYEQLVQFPEQTLQYVANFLLPGHGHNERIRNVSSLVHRNSLWTWIKSVPLELQTNVSRVAPMLGRLGYDVDHFPPNNTGHNPLWLKFDSSLKIVS